MVTDSEDDINSIYEVKKLLSNMFVTFFTVINYTKMPEIVTKIGKKWETCLWHYEYS